MKLKNKMRLLFKSIFTSFGSAIAEDGTQILWNEEGDIAEGYEVYKEIENEETGELEYVALEEGEYVLEDGRTIVVDSESKVAEIREKEEAPAAPEAPAQEEMEEEAPAAPEAPADPSTEEVITEPEEPFDAKKAYDDLKIEFEAMKAEMDKLKEQVAALLEVPAEENAFSAAKKKEETVQKGFICKVAKK
jgi:hypothetical protein